MNKDEIPRLGENARNDEEVRNQHLGDDQDSIYNPVRVVSVMESNNPSIWTRVCPRPVYVWVRSIGAAVVMAQRIYRSTFVLPLVRDMHLLLVRKIAPVDPSIIEVASDMLEVPSDRVFDDIQRVVFLFRPEEKFVRILQHDGTYYDEDWDKFQNSDDFYDKRALSMLYKDFPDIWYYAVARPGVKHEILPTRASGNQGMMSKGSTASSSTAPKNMPSSTTPSQPISPGTSTPPPSESLQTPLSASYGARKRHPFKEISICSPSGPTNGKMRQKIRVNHGMMEMHDFLEQAPPPSTTGSAAPPEDTEDQDDYYPYTQKQTSSNADRTSDMAGSSDSVSRRTNPGRTVAKPPPAAYQYQKMPPSYNYPLYNIPEPIKDKSVDMVARAKQAPFRPGKIATAASHDANAAQNRNREQAVAAKEKQILDRLKEIEKQMVEIKNGDAEEKK